MSKLAAAMAALGVVILGGGAMAGAAPADKTPTTPTTTTPAPPTTIGDDALYGVGPSGDGPAVPDCPVNTYVAADGVTSAPLALQIPNGTREVPIDAVCPVTTDLETQPNGSPTFTDSSQMETLLACMVPAAVVWMTWEYGTTVPPAAWTSQSGSLLPNHFVFVPDGVLLPSDGTTCNWGTDPLDIFGYCYLDGNVYMGQQATWELYGGLPEELDGGDALVAAAIAHEMGHRIQHVAGGREAATANAEIPDENQADCFAGAFIDYAARQGLVDVSTTGDDLVDLFGGFFEMASTVGPNQTHGSHDQRLRAFFVGYNSPNDQSAWSCNFYLTDISIVPPSS